MVEVKGADLLLHMYLVSKCLNPLSSTWLTLGSYAHAVRKFNFANRVILIWNSLSNHVDDVVSVDTVSCFKNHFDKFGLIK